MIGKGLMESCQPGLDIWVPLASWPRERDLGVTLANQVRRSLKGAALVVGGHAVQPVSTIIGIDEHHRRARIPEQVEHGVDGARAMRPHKKNSIERLSQ
jgi:hypothetical protein